MTTVTIQQAFEACQTIKNTWLKRKAELADLEREYREQLLAGDEQIPRRMQDLRDNIDVKRWEINQAAGRYIRSHEEVQHISIRNRLHDFMQQHGAALLSVRNAWPFAAWIHGGPLQRLWSGAECERPLVLTLFSAPLRNLCKSIG